MFHPDTYAFRESIKGLDNKYRFQEFWVDGVDSSALLDSIGMQGEIFRTYDFDRYYTGPSRGNCPSILATFPNRRNSKLKIIAGNRYTIYGLGFNSINGLKGKVYAELVGGVGVVSGDTFRRTQTIVILPIDTLYFAFNRNIVTITSNRNGHERKLVIY